MPPDNDADRLAHNLPAIEGNDRKQVEKVQEQVQDDQHARKPDRKKIALLEDSASVEKYAVPIARSKALREVERYWWQAPLDECKKGETKRGPGGIYDDAFPGREDAEIADRSTAHGVKE